MEDRESLKPTYDLGQMAANLKATNLSSAAIRWAKHCILDWIAVTVAGSDEDLTKKIIAVAELENFRKRSTNEITNALKYANSELLLSIIPL